MSLEVHFKKGKNGYDQFGVSKKVFWGGGWWI